MRGPRRVLAVLSVHGLHPDSDHEVSETAEHSLPHLTARPCHGELLERGKHKLDPRASFLLGAARGELSGEEALRELLADLVRARRQRPVTVELQARRHRADSGLRYISGDKASQHTGQPMNGETRREGGSRPAMYRARIDARSRKTVANLAASAASATSYL
jgi:hypothetical protein